MATRFDGATAESFYATAHERAISLLSAVARPGGRPSGARSIARSRLAPELSTTRTLHHHIYQ